LGQKKDSFPIHPMNIHKKLIKLLFRIYIGIPGSKDIDIFKFSNAYLADTAIIRIGRLNINRQIVVVHGLDV